MFSVSVCISSVAEYGRDVVLSLSAELLDVGTELAPKRNVAGDGGGDDHSTSDVLFALDGEVKANRKCDHENDETSDRASVKAVIHDELSFGLE